MCTSCNDLVHGPSQPTIWNHRLNSYMLKEQMSQSSHPSHLLCLHALLVPILSEWISDEDLCYLDSAVCSQELRNKFLRVMETSCVNSISNFNHNTFGLFKEWLLLRKLRLKKYKIEYFDSSMDQLMFQGEHLSEIDSRCGWQLYDFFDWTTSRPDVVRLTVRTCSDYKYLKSVGPMVTHLLLRQSFQSVAPYCPNLRSIEMPTCFSFHPFLDHCPYLETIKGCHLKSLIDGRNCSGNYSCALKRTENADECAVSFGYGKGRKYFNLTGLSTTYKFSQEDFELLSPLVKHLTEVATYDTSLMKVLALNCNLLTKLNTSRVDIYEQDLLALLSHSPLLRVGTFGSEQRSYCMDPILYVLSIRCPLLEKCSIGPMVTSEALSSFFERCSALTWFQFCGLSSDHHITAFSRSGITSGRTTAVQMGSTEPQHVVETIFKHLPGLKRITITPNFLTKDVDTFNLKGVHSLFQLTSLRISGVKNLRLLLTRCTLTSLTLESCTFNPSLLTEIGDNCPRLILLDLCRSPVQNADIVQMMGSYSKLEHLHLTYCKFITCSLVQELKSTSLRCLKVTDTSITKRDLENVNVDFRVIVNLN